MTYALHFSPAKGWLNDPNGLIEHRGVHHLFFQYNPFGTEMAMTGMHWGHATSTDLLHWVEQPVALEPGPAGSCDDDGCWSGCAVTTPHGVALIYSGNHDGRQLPCLATADDDDLRSWTKDPGNPVIRTIPPIPGLTDFRDHSVQPVEGGWRQVIAAGTGEPAGGLLLAYTSPDLHAWTERGIFLSAADEELPGPVWECPDVFALDGQDVVLLSYFAGSRPGSSGEPDVLWLTGEFLGDHFTPTRYGRLDLGALLYAPQSYPTSDGRRLLFGWLRTQADPAAAGRVSVGAMSLPRQLTVSSGRVHQAPAAEVTARRHDQESADLQPGQAVAVMSLPGGRAVEIILNAGTSAELVGTTIVLTDHTAGTSHDVDLACLAPASSWVRSARGWAPEVTAPREARIILDAGIVEIFLDDGRAAAFSDLSVEHVDHVEIRRTTTDHRLGVRSWLLG